MKAVFFGELMITLTTKAHERFVQASEGIIRFTGGEANAAVLLAGLGVECYVVAKVPAHEVGEACLNFLRRFGVRTEYVIRGGDRLGLIYVESGAGHRSAKVIYDRTGSAYAGLGADELDWDSILAEKDWLHFAGTAPAMGERVRGALREGLANARRRGVRVSCDLNYRSRLWPIETARGVLQDLAEQVDLLIGNEGQIRDVLEIGDGCEPGDAAGLARELASRFGVQYLGMTNKRGGGVDPTEWSAAISDGAEAAHSPVHRVQVIEPIGAGDAFSGGLIHGFLKARSLQQTVDFAAAAACLKMSIPGDFAPVSEAEIEALMAGGEAGRVQR